MKTEAQLRYEAKKQGYTLKKSRRGYSGNNFGGYMVIDSSTNFIAAGENFNMQHSDVEKFLDEE